MSMMPATSRTVSPSAGGRSVLTVATRPPVSLTSARRSIPLAGSSTWPPFSSRFGRSLMEIEAVSAVDQERLTGSELGFRQAEEAHCSGDVLGPAEPAGGDVALGAGPGVGAGWRAGAVGDGAGDDAVDADAMWRQLIGEVLGHDLDRTLRAVVDRGILVDRVSADRADIDDPPAATPLDHVPRGVLRQHEWGAKVDVDLLFPVAVADLPKMAPNAHASIVDEDVQPGDQAQRRFGQPVCLAHL